jgi:hypothetical protein
MPIELTPRALLHPQTHALLAYPAIDMRSHQRVENAAAYARDADEAITGLRPDRSLKRVLDYLAAPQTAALSPAERKQGLLEYTSDPVKLCPYEDPVVAADGETYSFDTMVNWAQSCQEKATDYNRPFSLTSPLYGKALANPQLIPATAMRALMAELGVEVQHGPTHSYDLSTAPSVVTEPMADDMSQVFTAAVEPPRRRHPRSPSPSWIAEPGPVGIAVSQIQAIDESLMRLAQTIQNIDSGNVRFGWIKKRRDIKHVERLITRAAGAAPQRSGGALCRRAADLKFLEQDLREATKYVNLGLERNPADRAMHCRLAFVHAWRFWNREGSIENARQPLSQFFDVPQHEAFDALALWVAQNRDRTTIYWPLLPTYAAYLKSQRGAAWYEGSQTFLPVSHYLLMYTPEHNF